jgi:hypothetical protein
MGEHDSQLLQLFGSLKGSGSRRRRGHFADAYRDPRSRPGVFFLERFDDEVGILEAKPLAESDIFQQELPVVPDNPVQGIQILVNKRRQKPGIGLPLHCFVRHRNFSGVFFATGDNTKVFINAEMQFDHQGNLPIPDSAARIITHK